MTLKLMIPIFLPAILGFLFLSRLLTKSRLPLKKIFIPLFSPAAGYALISFGFFICYVCQVKYTRVASAVFPGFLAAILLIRSFQTQGGQHQGISLSTSLRSCFFGGFQKSAFGAAHSALSWTLAALLSYTLIHFCEYLAGYMSWNAFGGWDARYFWLLKARFYFRDPEVWRLMFSHWLAWGNNDYPLMIPGIVAWGWTLLGREMLVWPMIIAAVFIFSLAGLIFWYLAANRSWSTALAATLFFLTTGAYRFWAGTLYCDIPYAFFSTGAVLFLMTALREKELRVFALAGFFSGCAAWTKNEGIVFTLWFGLLNCFLLLREARRNHKYALKVLLALLLGILLPALVCLYFKVRLTDHQTHIIQRQTPAEFFSTFTNLKKIHYIFAGFMTYMANWQNWHGLWFFFLAALVYWPISRKTSSALAYTWIPAVMTLLIQLGYAAVFTQSSLNIQKHLQTGLLRLLLHTAALAIVFAFETFGFERDLPPPLLSTAGEKVEPLET